MAENAGLPQEYFDRMYDKAADPWSFSTRWYERRKRALTMAALTRPRYASVLELGCSIGLLTEQLSERAETVVALDISAEAVERARRSLAGRVGVRVEQADVRDELPPGPFELIVVSEVAYYLSRSELEALAATIAARLDPEGEVLLCHWRWPVDDYPLGGDEAQDILIRGLAMPRLSRLQEDDLVLDVLQSGCEIRGGARGTRMSEGISSLLVVIPARDEEKLLPRCLDALARAVDEVAKGHPMVQVECVVVADRTTDGTQRIVTGTPTVDLLVVEVGNVGAARRAGVDHLLPQRGPASSTWIATTDADSIVPRDWLLSQVDLAVRGADLVVGSVTPEREGLSHGQFSAWEAFSRRHDPTGDIHGANLGIRASAYLGLGGFDSLTVGEDVDLVTRAVAAGFETVRATGAPVVTSSRIDGRAPDGYASWLHRGGLMPDTVGP